MRVLLKQADKRMFGGNVDIALKMLHDPHGRVRQMSLVSFEAAQAAYRILLGNDPASKRARLKRITQGLVDHDRCLTRYPRDRMTNED